MRREYVYVDAGNTALKAWHVSESGRLTAWRGKDALALKAWVHEVAAGQGNVKITLASVRGQAHTKALCASLGGPVVLEVNTALLPTVYAEPERLGIDRWLSVLAARDEAQTAVVVDAGTAITVDLLRHGAHQGGYILPGLLLQADALQRATARVRFPEPDWDSVLPGRDTASCVGHGIIATVVALILSLAREHDASILVDGGDAGRLLPWLPGALHRPLLMPKGMALAASHPWHARSST